MAIEGATVSRPRAALPGVSGEAPVAGGSGEGPKPRRWPAAVMIASVVAAAGAYAWLGSAVVPGTAKAGAPAAMASPAIGRAKPPQEALPSFAQGDESPGPHAAMPLAEPTVYLRDRELTSPRRDAASRRFRSGGESPAMGASAAPTADGAHAGSQSKPAPSQQVAANGPGAVPGVAAPQDPLQALDAALTQCGGNFIERIACGQRARFRYCDGYWGRAPECPSGAVAVNR